MGNPQLASPPIPPGEDSLSRALEWFSDEHIVDTSTWSGWIVSQVPSFFRQAFVATGRLWVGFVRQFINREKCNVNTFGFPYVTLAILDLVEKWLGLGLEKFKGKYRRWIDWTCPTAIPDQNDVNAIWLGDDVSDEQWVNLTKANNQCPEWQEKVRHTNRTQPNVEQLFAYYMRSNMSQEEFVARLRGAGVIDLADLTIFERLSRFTPGAQDVISFMVRDVFDPRVVEQERLSEEFEVKFQGPALDLARANGIDEETMLRYWQAHWILASPQQLFEMLHRLRPGRVAPELAVTREDVYARLKQADYSPWTSQHLIELSYRVNRLVDIRNAFFLGVIDEAELKEQFLDRGHNPRDAQVIVDLIREQKVQKALTYPEVKQFVDRQWTWDEVSLELRSKGFNDIEIGRIFERAMIARSKTWRKALTDPIVKSAIDYVTPWEEVTDYLRLYGYSDDEIDKVHFAVDQRARTRLKAKCIQALRKRFLQAETTPEEMHSSLIRVGVSAEDATQLVRAWGCELDARGKLLSASQMCKYASQGLITLTEYAQRLTRLGYDDREVSLIVTSCQIDIRERTAAQAERDRKAREAAQRRGQREAEAKRKEAERQALLEGKRRVTMVKRAQSYATQFQQVADMIAALTGNTFHEAGGSLEQEVGHLHNAYGMTAEGALSLVKRIVQDATKAKDPDWIGWVRKAEEFFPAVPPEPEFPGSEQ